MTKVFVSEYAFNDPALRSKLEAKGDLVLAQPGATVTMETNTLRLQARIVDIQYGTGPLPPNSYFEKMTVELAAWRKEASSVPAGAPAAQPQAQPVVLPSKRDSNRARSQRRFKHRLINRPARSHPRQRLPTSRRRSSPRLNRCLTAADSAATRRQRSHPPINHRQHRIGVSVQLPLHCVRQHPSQRHPHRRRRTRRMILSAVLVTSHRSLDRQRNNANGTLN